MNKTVTIKDLTAPKGSIIISYMKHFTTNNRYKVSVYWAIGLFLLLSCNNYTSNNENAGTNTALNEANSIRVYVFDTGRLVCNDGSTLISNLEKGKKVKLADPTYLIIHPKGTLVWDAGLSDSLYLFDDGLDVWGGSWNASVSKTLLSQFMEIDIFPDSIDYLAFSHFHSDHTGNAPYFGNSTMLIQEDAYDFAFTEGAEQYGFNPTDYSSLKSKVKKLNGEFDVFGDQSVMIIPTPGHSPGHQILYIDLPKTGPVILSGDLYIINQQLENSWVPNSNVDKELTMESYKLVDKLMDSTSSSLWIQHDLEQFNTMKLSPQFYE